MTASRAGRVPRPGCSPWFIGVLVLRAPGAQAEAGWFSYGGPPSPELLDSLLTWNLARAVGALPVLLGLLVLSHLVAVLVGRRSGESGARSAARALVLGGVLVLGGLAAFAAVVVLGLHDRSQATISISRAVAPLTRFGPPGSVWTRTQAVAALVLAAGLLVGAVGTGLRPGRPR